MDINISVKVSNEFAEAADNLAAAISGATNSSPENIVSVNTEEVTQTADAPIQDVPPQAIPEQTVVHTRSKEYSLDELSKAAVSLMDMGRQQELLGLLSQFGVQSMPQLQPSQYGAFATALREKGAAI